MPRRIEVEITGDSRQLERAFDRAGRSAENFNQDMAVSAGKAAAITFAFTQALEGAAAASKVFFGENAQLTRGLGDASAGISALTRLDLAGFFNATQGAAERSRKSIEDYTKGLKDANQAAQALKVAQVAQAFGWDDLAEKLRDQVALLESARVATDAVAFSQRQFNTTVIDGVNALVAYKGARDSLGLPMGPGGVAAEPVPPKTRTYHPTLPPMSPSQRRELELIGQEGAARLPGLFDRLRQLKGMLADFNGSQQQRLRIAENIARTEAEIAGIYSAQAAAAAATAASRKAAAEAAAAEAAARERARRAAAKTAEQAREFRLIGLGPSGQELVPTTANLQRQFAQLQQGVKGQDVPQKLLNRFAGIKKALREGNLTEETRAAIRDFFRMVRGEFDKGDDLLKPVAVRGLNTKALLAGMGLSAQEIRRLRGRLAGVSAKGTSLAPTGGVGAYGMQTDVYLDGDKVGMSMKRYGQRHSINSPKQKRGPNAGR